MKTKYVIIGLLLLVAIVAIIWFVNAPKAIYPTATKVGGSTNPYGQFCPPPRMWHNGFCV